MTSSLKDKLVTVGIVLMVTVMGLYVLLPLMNPQLTKENKDNEVKLILSVVSTPANLTVPLEIRVIINNIPGPVDFMSKSPWNRAVKIPRDSRLMLSTWVSRDVPRPITSDCFIHEGKTQIDHNWYRNETQPYRCHYPKIKAESMCNDNTDVNRHEICSVRESALRYGGFNG